MPQIDWDEFTRLVRSTAHRVGATSPLELELVEHYVACLMATPNTPPLADYRTAGRRWHGIMVGRLRKRYFGLGRYGDKLVVHARVVTGPFAGVWRFDNDAAGISADRNRGPCDELHGVYGRELMNAVLGGVLTRA